jgi:hypothetical protein
LFDDDSLPATVADLVGRYGYVAARAEVELHRPVESVPSAPARHTDPETSHAAARTEPDVSRFSIRSRQSKLLHVFIGAPRTDHEATARVVGVHAVPSAWDGCRRRCSDLRAAGYLADTGIRRRNPGSNEDSIVWQVTLAGLTAIHELDTSGWSR